MGKNVKYNTYPIDVCSLEANWWVFALRGVFSIMLGIVALFMPVATIMAMTMIFGFYTITDGIFSIVAGINRARRGKQWGWLIFSGVLSVAAGLVVLITPQVASVGLTIFLWTMIPFWAITTGVSEVISALRLRKEIQGEWLLVLNGMLTVSLGTIVLILLWVNPVASLVSLAWLISSNFIASGLMLLLLAGKLYKREKTSASLNHEEVNSTNII